MRRVMRIVMVALTLTTLLGGCQLALKSREAPGSCGDGVTQTSFGEQCDDGNTVSGDGCSKTCQTERPVCGDGIVQTNAGEECDDGPKNDDKAACTSRCRRAYCGDGLVGPGETCDDGNTDNGDGCSPDCRYRGRLTLFGGKTDGMGARDGSATAARFAGITGLAVVDRQIWIGDAGAGAIRLLHLDTSFVSTRAGGLFERYANVVPGDWRNLDYGPKRLVVADKQTIFASDGAKLLMLPISSGLGKFVSPISDCAELSSTITALAATSDTLYVAEAKQVWKTVEYPCTCAPKPGSPPRCALTKVGTTGAFVDVTALAADGTNNKLYFADGNTIASLDLASGAQTAVAGGEAGHVDGSGTSARFYAIKAMLLDGQTLYALEQTPGRWTNVRTIKLGIVTVSTLAGSIAPFAPNGAASEADGFGAYSRIIGGAALARIDNTLLVGTDSAIRAIELTTAQTATVAGRLLDDMSYYQARALAMVKQTLYVGTTGGIRELNLAGSQQSAGGPGGPGKICGDRDRSRIVALHATRSHLYATDAGNGVICRFPLGLPVPEGEVVFPVERGKKTDVRSWDLRGLAFDGTHLYVAAMRPGLSTPGPAVLRVTPGSAPTTDSKYESLLALGEGADPRALIALSGKLFVADFESSRISRVDLASGKRDYIGKGTVALPNGQRPPPPPSTDGSAAEAAFCGPVSFATDGSNLFVGEALCSPDGFGQAIRQIDLESLAVTTLIGGFRLGRARGSVVGVGSDAAVTNPVAMVYDAKGKSLLVLDGWEHWLGRVD